MSGTKGLTSPDRSEGVASSQTPPRGEAGTPEPTRKARLRLVYNRDAIIYNPDAQEGAHRMKSRSSSPAPAPAKVNGMLDRELQGKIGRMLRDIFSDVAQEPVPERLVKLLEALEAREKGR
jgi:Anti-sigma factor NepR